MIEKNYNEAWVITLLAAMAICSIFAVGQLVTGETTKVVKAVCIGPDRTLAELGERMKQYQQAGEACAKTGTGDVCVARSMALEAATELAHQLVLDEDCVNTPPKEACADGRGFCDGTGTCRVTEHTH